MSEAHFLMLDCEPQMQKGIVHVLLGIPDFLQLCLWAGSCQLMRMLRHSLDQDF